LPLQLLLDIKHLYIKMVSGVHVWLVLWKATRALEAHAEASIASLGMCRSDFGVLEALLHKGPLAVHELGVKVLLTSGSITTAIDRLERRGLVARGSDPRDRRARIIRLTEPGRKAIRGAFADHERAMEQAVSHLASKDRVTLLKLLRRLGQGANLDK
jgi:MarR family transcriptional regulator, 2-MHQ and catechol-resistance regulon repressor